MLLLMNSHEEGLDGVGAGWGAGRGTRDRALKETFNEKSRHD